ncbi:MAG: cytidylate kinase-like family protein, partial [Deltaproteobacteria bacterium]|nr:cytidylate kinase-like family protein [Deltaproteobacteria bacterium]
MAVVSISRQYGAGGKTLALRLARKLGYQFIDRGILAKVAQEANVSVDWVEAVEKEPGSLMRLVSRVVSSDFIERHVGPESADFDDQKYHLYLKKVLTEIADEGDAVILGRGSQFILQDHPKTVRILLVGDMEARIGFLMENYDLSRSSAQDMIRREEKRRTAFLKNLGAGDSDAPDLYHLAINTSLVNLDWA